MTTRPLSMQITLNQTEILEAIKDYVRKQVKVAENQKDFDIELKATRGDSGYTATLEITLSPASAPHNGTTTELKSASAEVRTNEVEKSKDSTAARTVFARPKAD